MKKVEKAIRYSVKFYPNGKILVYELKNIVPKFIEVEKEIIKNDEFTSYIYDDLFSVCDTNFDTKIFKSNKCKILDKKSDVENSFLSEKTIKTAINRTRNKVYDIVFCNDWTYFITLTFNKEKVNSRYDYVEVSKKLRKFLNNYKNLFDDKIKYLIIPEKHEDGAFHFHGFLYVSDESYFIDSGHKTNGKVGDTIFNWLKYRYGWSNLTRVKSKEKCCNYILKYITKDLFLDNDFCKRHFSCSQNCIRPIKQTYEHFDLTEFDFKYENDFVKIFEYQEKIDT